MIIYNVTTIIDWAIHEEWFLWMREEYISGMMATGFFNDYRMMRLLQVDETDGPTYAVQYFAGSLDQYYLFIERQSAIQSQIEYNKWGNKFTAFGTVMEVVH